MRGLLFAVGDDGLDVVESGALQQVGDLHFGEAEVGVGVEFAGFLKAVLQKIEDDEATPRARRMR